MLQLPHLLSTRPATLPAAAVQSVPAPSIWLGVLEQGPELEHGATAGSSATECLPPGCICGANVAVCI
jgi:hypothetical protein